MSKRSTFLEFHSKGHKSQEQTDETAVAEIHAIKSSTFGPVYKAADQGSSFLQTCHLKSKPPLGTTLSHSAIAKTLENLKA